MVYSETSLLETNPGNGENCESEIIFGSADGHISEALKNAPGKVLCVFDQTGCIFSEAALSPRTISAVFDGDCLPLFSMPDGVSRVLAAGSAETLRAARYFAEVRGIGALLFPVSGMFDGVFERRGEICLGGTSMCVPLKGGKTVCDGELVAPSLARAYARLLLGRLADFEAHALTAFGIQAAACGGEGEWETAEEICLANAARRRQEAEGAYEGEGVALARLLGGEVPEWSAYLKLSALYAAFFSKGKPRRYFTPDYRARAREAGTDRSAVPSPEEYVLRALALERCRAPLLKEISGLADRRGIFFKRISQYAEVSPYETREGLKYLPERFAGGLSSIIRDFGLMEWQ